MGDVIHADFSRPRRELKGFLPEESDQKQELVKFAKKGEPIADHSFNPDDCA